MANLQPASGLQTNVDKCPDGELWSQPARGSHGQFTAKALEDAVLADILPPNGQKVKAANRDPGIGSSRPFTGIQEALSNRGGRPSSS